VLVSVDWVLERVMHDGFTEVSQGPSNCDVLAPMTDLPLTFSLREVHRGLFVCFCTFFFDPSSVLKYTT